MNTTPCGIPVTIAGHAHTSACILCKRIDYANHPQWAAGAVGVRERASHPLVTSPTPRVVS